MSQAINKLGKKIYYNNARVVIKDSKGSILGNFFLKTTGLAEILNLRMKIAHSKKAATMPTNATTRAKKVLSSALCIVRHKGEYHITSIPNDFSFAGISCRHLCSKCVHCYASTSSKDGCQKIKNRLFEALIHKYDLKEAVIRSSRIEKYPFILEGVETFGCKGCDGYKTLDVFLVFECANFCSDSRKPKEIDAEATEHLRSSYMNLEKDTEEVTPLVKRRKKIRFPYNTHPYQ